MVVSKIMDVEKLRTAFAKMTNDGKCITIRPYRNWEIYDVGMVDLRTDTFLSGELVLTFEEFMARDLHMDRGNYLESYL